MRLVCLNTWGNRVDASLKFIEDNSSADIFCLQEVLMGGTGKTEQGELKNGFEYISKLLSKHTGYYSEYISGSHYGERTEDLDYKFGMACFVKSNLKHAFIQDFRLCDVQTKWNDYSGRFAAGVAMEIEVEGYLIFNVHAVWQGSIKTDTEAKIEQSRILLNILEQAKGKRIICGDFNLLPGTKSIQMLGDIYKDLIQEYKITSTRSTLYGKELRYSDYIFTDKDVTVNNFSVSDVTVSDHLPLLLDFTLI
jgi:endonuclease/exonuclease/phosphatase family metal-dependent hydrolase